MAPLNRRARRAFTLLEVLLAIALLGILSALIATMWSQARDWAIENASAQRVLRLPRITELLRSQWADRRATVGIGRAADAVKVAPAEFSFVTATPILFPEWPLVTATWRIKPDPEASSRDVKRFLIEYEEAPVTSFEAAPAPKDGEKKEDDEARNRRQRMESEGRVRIEPRQLVILRGADSLAVERWGPGYRFDALTLRTPSLREDDDDAEDDEPQPEGPVPEGPDAWRPIEPQFEGVPPAVRFSGTHEGKRFECTLIVGDSR